MDRRESANSGASSRQTDLLTPTIQQTLHAVGERGLGLGALLFVAGHQPVAFLAGQALLLLAPLGVLWGSNALTEWARLLSDPDGGRLLHRSLLDVERRSEG